MKNTIKGNEEKNSGGVGTESPRPVLAGVALPPEPPSGLCWQYKGDGEWELQPTEPATLYKIMVGNRYHCGYYNRESAERFLPGYQEDYPKEILTIQEEASECPVAA